MSVPLTVIGGYLGAGKTTLINALLAHDLERRLAILVNDFGAVSVDEHLIAGQDGPMMQLTNGCVCCTLADAMSGALTELSTLALDHVVLEASGVAVPDKLATIGSTWPGFAHHATVVLFDAGAVLQQLTDPYIGDLISTQLRDADLRLATKLDLCDDRDARVETLTERVGAFDIVDNGRIDPARLFDLEPIPRGTHADLPAHEFRSATFETTRTLSLESVHVVLNDARSVLERCKGWITTTEGRFIVQLAGGRLTLLPDPADDRDDRTRVPNRLVLISRDRACDRITDRLHALNAQST